MWSVTSQAFRLITNLVVLSGDDADLNGSCWRCKHKFPEWKNNETKENITKIQHGIKQKQTQ